MSRVPEVRAEDLDAKDIEDLDEWAEENRRPSTDEEIIRSMRVDYTCIDCKIRPRWMKTDLCKECLMARAKAQASEVIAQGRESAMRYVDNVRELPAFVRKRLQRKMQKAMKRGR